MDQTLRQQDQAEEEDLTLIQAVTISRLADRHEDPHDRRFAQTQIAHVSAGSLPTVLDAALAIAGDLPRGSYVIRVEWPREA